jgi:tryptophanyl-tRNA synthetase
VAQAADITAFKATLVPVGEDQIPMLEQCNEIVRRLNRQAGREILVQARALVPTVGRLPGIDGTSKMSKSAGNALPLSASSEEIATAVRRMYTDPGHLRASDPGQVEGNVVFTYLDAFDHNRDEVEDLKAQYRRGGLGDVTVKRRLEEQLQALLAPIRKRRAEFAARPDDVRDVIRDGTLKARELTQATLDEVKSGLGLFQLG